MGALGELLHERKEGLLERWLDVSFGGYADDAAAFFKRQKNQFANPVGGTHRECTRSIFEGLVSDAPTEDIAAALEELIRVRAIQDFSPSQAIAFVLRLKRIIRKELGKRARDPRYSADLLELEGKIDGVALLAFDIYVRYRELVYELRIKEVKRGVAGLWERFHDRYPTDHADTQDDPENPPEPAADENLFRGGTR